MNSQQMARTRIGEETKLEQHALVHNLDNMVGKLHVP